MNHREGYELTHVQGRITAAHLFLVATEGYAAIPWVVGR